MKQRKRKVLTLLVALTMVLQVLSPISTVAVKAEESGTVSNDGEVSTVYTEPESPAVTYNMNIDWKYKRAVDDKIFPLATAKEGVAKDGKEFYEVGYDDSDWETVSLPHAINADDSFDGAGIDAGEISLYRGFMFYRKNVTVPATDAGKKFILEFEAFRQSIYVYVNGTMAGYYEAGVAAVGFDITDYIKAGEENLIAVATDNASDRGATFRTQETIAGHEPGDLSGVGYQWNTKDFNEVQGGLTGNVNLYAKNKIYQTLPLYNNLKTKGNYIHADNFDFREGSADITVEAEIRNETDKAEDITLEVNVVDAEGKVVASFEKTQNVGAASDTQTDNFLTMVPSTAYDADGNGVETGTVDSSTVDVTTIVATQNVEGLKFWSDVAPNLYDVYTILRQGDTVIDTQKTTTGFREVTYDKDKGLMINGVTTYLTGYAQRSTNEWAAIGVANDWLSDIDMKLVKESNANMIRWMHIAPNPVDIRAGDKYGVVSICPAGDKEGDTTGRAWDQRLETMRDVIIYFRNSPSVIFWEAGNNAITAEHMKQMTDLRKELDPSGDRFMGCRTISSEAQIKEAEWVGTMENRNDAAAYASMVATGRYLPMVETEYHRNESPRRVWDDYTPDDYDYVNKYLGDGASKQDGYDIWDQTQEDFARTMANRYSYFYDNRVGGTGSNYYVGAALMVWSDSNMHVRNCGSENCRTSGRVDPIRVKKESFYAIQAIQAKDAVIKIMGHWNYPSYIKGDKENGNYWYEDKTFNGTYWEGNGTYLQRDPTNKTVYVMASTTVAKVELYVNDELAGTDTKPDSNCIYAFSGIDVTASGKVSAKAYNDRDEVVAEDEIVTSGSKATVRLKPMTGPEGFLADGSDLMYVDVEMIDENGNICLIDESKISFTVSDTAKATFIGGYNSGIDDRIVNHKDYVFAECGINRVFLQSTREAGDFTLTATVEGLQPVSVNLSSKEVVTEGGLTTVPQQSYGQGEIEDIVYDEGAPALKSLGGVFTADFNEENGNVYAATEDKKDYYEVTVNGAAVAFTDKAYKPDSSTGVVGEVTPIVEALKAAGLDVSYTYATEGSVPDYLVTMGGVLPWMQVVSGETTVELANVSTNVFTNGENSLTNFGVTTNSTKTTLLAELSAVIGKLPGVSINMDTVNKVFEITYGATAAQSGEELLVEEEEKADALAADEVAAYSDCNTAYGAFTLSEDTSPDGTNYWSTTTEIKVDGDGFTLAGDSKADLLWEADVRFDADGGGVAPRNKANNYGTCIRSHNNKLSVQTGGSSYTEYCEIDTDTWYHIELLGRYSASDANVDMTVYKYNGSEKELINTYTSVNLRNLSANNKSGAMCWSVYAGTSVDNLKITRLAADAITVSAKDGETSVTAGNQLQFAYSATRQGAYITKPAVTWSLYNEDGTEELTDENLSIDANGILTVGLGLEKTQTITVKAVVTGTDISDSVQIQVNAVSLDAVKFDTLTLSADRAYVKAGEPLTITAAAAKDGAEVALTADDLIWYICDSTNMRKLGDNLKWITVENGVLTVNEQAISQDIVVRAADSTDVVRGFYAVHVKSSDALENGEDGVLDTLLFADNCETVRSDAEFVTSVDGTSGYNVLNSYMTANITGTSSDIVVEMDIRFSKEGAGFQPRRADGGKLNTCVVYHDGKLAVQTGGSSYTSYSNAGEVTTEDWYHITLIRKQGSYAHMIFDFYDENGAIDLSKRKIIKDVNQRNDDTTGCVNFEAGTMYDNLRILSPVPTEITVDTDAKQVFAGNTVQASSTLLWNGLEMKNPDGSSFEYKLYDAENKYPLDTDKITINSDGLITVDAMADAQDVYVRAIAKKSGEYASTKFSVVSSDIFAVDSIGIDETNKRIVELKVNRNFYYKDEVTFITEIFDENGAVKAVGTKQMYGEALRNGENIVAIGMDIPADFDKTKDVIKVFTVTRIGTDEATTENTEGASVEIRENSAYLTVPAYDENSDVVVLILKRDANEKKVKDKNILYFNQVDASEVANAIPVGSADRIIAKTGGKVNGTLVLNAALLGDRSPDADDEDPEDSEDTGSSETTGDSQKPSTGDSETTGDSQKPSTGDSETTGNSQTPSTGDSETTGNSQTPSTGDSETTGNSQTPSTGDSQTPSTGDSQTPSTGDSQKPSTGDSQTPSTGDSQTPSTGDSQKPSTGDSQTTGNSETDGKTEAPVLEKGKSFKVSGATYKVTKTGENPTVVYNTAPKKTKLTIPATVSYKGVTYKVTSIGAKALKPAASKVKTITVGNNVTAIGKNVFAGCKKLTSVTLGTSVKTIGKEAFKGDARLKTIVIKSTKLKTVGKNALKGINPKAVIKVPKKQLDAYRKLLKNKGQGKNVTIKK